MIRLVSIALLLAGAAEAQGRFDRTNSRCASGRSGRGLACAGGVQLADALQAGDLSGSWWAMYGDGTMRSGSSVTLVATGTPTNTVENGWPVRTYTSAQNDQEPANVAFPASDFSVCMHRRSSAVVAGEAMCFGTSTATNPPFAAAPFEQQAGGSFFSFISDGASIAGAPSGGSFSAGAWFLACFTYQRVGAGTSVGTLYINGAQAAQSSTMRLAQALLSVWSTNGCAAAANSPATTSSVRGAFVTYKLLSAADIARIYAATAP